MRAVPPALTAAWNSGDFLGAKRPIARVTAQASRISRYRVADNDFHSILFRPPDAHINRPRELHTVKSVSWQRSVDTDAATCTVVLHNLRDAPSEEDLDRPGYYGWMHGRAPFSSRWDQKPNIHNWLLMPDNILRTYEGYGQIPVEPGTPYRDIPPPEHDTNLVLTGVWIIDDIEMTHDGQMIINCRDLARMLHDHHAFPPVVPLKAGPRNRLYPDGKYAYPLSFTGADEPRGSRNYSDYTEIVKLLCAWGGFYWPRNARIRHSGGPTWSSGEATWYEIKFQRDDPFLRIGRVWGDLEMSGTFGPASIPPNVFDKKPLIDGVTYVRDILGFMFYVDETGAAVFRHPNIFQRGNLWRTDSPESGSRTNQMVTIDEERTLISLTTKLSSRNVRERVFVASTNGKYGGMAQGWNPNPRGWRRVSGWTDQHFESNRECQVMADMIALRQLFDYRTDRLQIPGYPAIQIDDQVRIMERVTGEGYIHYIKGITSNLDMEEGNYTYDLDTHWLGDRPFKKWAFDPEQLSRWTKLWLRKIYGGSF